MYKFRSAYLVKPLNCELAFADHPLVPVYLVFYAIARSIALAEQQADDLKAAFGVMLDAPFGEKFDRLADVEFVL
jgi:hypothetical protein